MRKLQYYLVDVFTDRPFGGNPLAVFPDAQGISPAVMQSLAKELNLSETTFVLPPQQAGNDCQVRIFTPAVELPMAGHPTVGTAFILSHNNLISLTEPETTLLFEEGVGVIRVTLSVKDGQASIIQMRQPLPTFGPQFTERDAIMRMLSLDAADFDAALPFEVVSCGVPFLYVPVKSLEAVRRIRFRRNVWEQTLRDFVAPHIFVFTQETETAHATVHSRMFAPAMGIVEDPATGAASGPLGCYLVRHELVKLDNVVEFVSEQGFEIGRPSFVTIKIALEGRRITGVQIGGQCYFMGEGSLELAM